MWGKKFWTSRYFYCAVGTVNAQTVERSLREDKRTHWEEEHREEQTTLSCYTAAA